MPLEGHWERQQTPLRPPTTRGGWALLATAVVLIVATVALLAYAVLDASSKPPAAGCIEVTSGSSTGGATIHACGRDAERLCRGSAHQDTPLARALRSQCGRLRGRHAGP